MFNYQTSEFLPGFPIIHDPAPREITLSDSEKELVEEIWHCEMQKSGGKLFNGKLFHVTSWDEKQIKGSFIDYKLYLAQSKNRQLKERISINPMGISGLTVKGDQILFGRRSSGLSQDSLCFELAPSGGVDLSSLVGDRIDLERQYLLELEEETGLTKEAVREVRPFVVVRDPETRVIEVCAEIVMDDTQNHPTTPSIDEYTQLFWLSREKIPHFIALNKNHFVKMSLFLLSLKGFI